MPSIARIGKIALCKLALLAGTFAIVSSPSAANAAIGYNSDVTAGSIGSFLDTTPGYMQVITVAGPNVAQKINFFTLFGIRYNTAQTATSAAVVLEFYTGIDTSPTSTDALATATLTDSALFNLPAAAIGSYNFTLGSASNLLDIDVPGSTFGVAVYYTNQAATAYNTGLGGRFTTGTPSVGSNDGNVYFDDDGDFTFEGAERANFGAPTNIRMVFDTTVVPEPTMLSLAGLGLVAMKRRRAR